jgi:hypothetical protein
VYETIEYELREEYVRLNYLFFLGALGGGITVARVALAASTAVVERALPKQEGQLTMEPLLDGTRGQQS